MKIECDYCKREITIDGNHHGEIVKCECGIDHFIEYSRGDSQESGQPKVGSSKSPTVSRKVAQEQANSSARDSGKSSDSQTLARFPRRLILDLMGLTGIALCLILCVCILVIQKEAGDEIDDLSDEVYSLEKEVGGLKSKIDFLVNQSFDEQRGLSKIDQRLLSLEITLDSIDSKLDKLRK